MRILLFGTRILPFSPNPEMCSERDSPLKRLYRRTHAKLTRLAGSGQLDWAAGCELSLALVHARRPAWPGETSETLLRVAPPRKTRPPDHTRVNWPVDASASGSAQVGPGGRHRWAARVQVGQELARQKAREGYPSHYTSLPNPSSGGGGGSLAIQAFRGVGGKLGSSALAKSFARYFWLPQPQPPGPNPHPPKDSYVGFHKLHWVLSYQNSM